MSETDKATATWRTCDIKSAAYLLYAGYSILAVLPDHGRAVFVFGDSDARKEALLAFWNKNQRVEPVAFIECQNRARDMVTQALTKKGD
jgi:hypothetical protein